MTYDRLVELFTRDMLVNEYATQFSDSLSYSDADYEQYYQENANTLDEYTITQFVFNATVDTVDADGNATLVNGEETYTFPVKMAGYVKLCDDENLFD